LLDHVMFTGNSHGNIHIFHIPEDLDEVVQIEHKQIHEKAITDIAASTVGNLVVTADDSGALCLWIMEQELQPVYTFPTFG